MRLITHLCTLALLTALSVSACDTDARSDAEATASTESPRTEQLSAEPFEAPVLEAPASRQVAPSCHEIEGQADALVTAAVAAGNACRVDTDCTVSFGQTSCQVLEDQIAISFAGLAGLEAASAALPALCSAAKFGPEAGGTSFDGECPYSWFEGVGLPAVCVAGTCQLGDYAGEEACYEAGEHASTIEGCIDCDLASAKASTALATALPEFVGCDVDTDCVIASDNDGHVEGCGVAINASLGDAWDATLDGIVRKYGMGNCPLASSDCLPQHAVCVEHACIVAAGERFQGEPR